MYKGSLCDKCLFSGNCPDVVNEPDNCTIICVRETDPLYKVFNMGYNAGYNDAADDYAADFDELDEALQEFDDDEEDNDAF